MKSTIFFAAFLLGITSCNTQRLVLKVNDAKKLEANEDNFIGKPLKKVLSEIKPKIKFVYGNPENTWAGATGWTYFTFYFVDKEAFKEIWDADDHGRKTVFGLTSENSKRGKNIKTIT